MPSFLVTNLTKATGAHLRGRLEPGQFQHPWFSGHLTLGLLGSYYEETRTDSSQGSSICVTCLGPSAGSSDQTYGARKPHSAIVSGFPQRSISLTCTRTYIRGTDDSIYSRNSVLSMHKIIGCPCDIIRSMGIDSDGPPPSLSCRSL